MHHTINQAAFVCLFVCSPTPPRSFDGSSPNLVGVCRWTSELPLKGSFLKRSMGQRVKGHFRSKSPDAILYDSRRHQAETTLLQKLAKGTQESNLPRRVHFISLCKIIHL